VGKSRKADRRARDVQSAGPDLAPADPPRRTNWDRRLWVILISAVLLLLGVYGYTGDTHFVPVTLGILNDGLFLAGWAASAGMLGAAVMRLLRLVLPQSDDGPALSLRLLTAIGIGIGLMSILLLGLGLAGAVNIFSAIAIVLLGPVLWGIMVRLEPGGVDRVRASLAAARAWLAAPAGWGWLWLLALPSLVVACCGASILPGVLWKPLDPHPYDVAAYHLQVPREWYEAGRILQLHHNVYCHFPFNAEMHFLLAMLLRGGPWKGMYTAQFISLATCVLFVAAVYAAATDWARRAGGNRRAAGTIAGVLAAAAPWVPMLGSLAFVEGMLLLYFTLSLAWVLRALSETHPGPALGAMAAGGLLAGFACGVKYTAVPTILIFFPLTVFAVTLIARLAGRQAIAIRPALLACVLYVAVGLAAFSPWLARNWAWTRNPVYPMAMRTLGSAHLDAVQVERWERAHRASQHDSPWPRRFHLLATSILAHWAFAYIVIPAGLLALIALAFRRDSAPQVTALALLVLLQLGFWIALTHLMPRFAVFLLPLCALAAGLWLSGRLAPAGAGLAVLAVWLGFIGIPGPADAPWPASLSSTFWPRSVDARVGFYRMFDLSPLSPAELEGLEDRRQVPLALIGDAQAFLHQVPMQRLRYRIIFDIRFPPGVASLDAWLGQTEQELRKDHVVFVHPGEVRRLSSTYFAVPGLPDRPVPRGYVTPNNNYQPIGDVLWTQTSDLPHIWPQGGVTGGR
jgi:hypothetical protein